MATAMDTSSTTGANDVWSFWNWLGKSPKEPPPQPRPDDEGHTPPTPTVPHAPPSEPAPAPTTPSTLAATRQSTPAHMHAGFEPPATAPPPLVKASHYQSRQYVIGGLSFEVDSRYRIKTVVGKGAYGLVCSGRHVSTNTLVAIKKIPCLLGQRGRMQAAAARDQDLAPL